MPARIVVVWDEREHLGSLVEALRDARCDVVGYADPFEAWDAVNSAQKIDVLVTKVEFGPGTVDGLAIARAFRVKRPGTRVLYIASSAMKDLTTGQGEYIPLDSEIPFIVAKAVALLAEPSAQ